MKLIKLGFAALLLSLAAVPPASAQDSYREQGVRIGGNEFKDIHGIRLGNKATLKGGFGTQGQYDTNVYLTSSKSTQDYIITLMPKLLMDLPFGIDERHLFQVMYMGEGGLFMDQTTQNYYNQRGAVNLNLIHPYGFANANDNFVDTVDRAGTEFTTQVHRLENTASATIGVERNKLSFEAGYTNFFEWYYKDIFKKLGYYENDFTGTIFYQLFSKTKALIDYKLGLIDYYRDKNRSGHSNQVTAGLKGDLTGKTVGIAKFGFQARDYNSGSGYTGYVGELGTITQFSERTKVTVKYYTAPIESTSASGNYYTANTVSAQLDQKIIHHFSGMLRSSISRNIYSQTDTSANVKRKDWLFDEGAWLYYNIKKWGKVGVGYDFVRRGSNIGTESYNDNLFSARFDLTF